MIAANPALLRRPGARWIGANVDRYRRQAQQFGEQIVETRFATGAEVVGVRAMPSAEDGHHRRDGVVRVDEVAGDVEIAHRERSASRLLETGDLLREAADGEFA